MDRLKTDIIGEGMPIVLDDLRFIQNAQNFAFESIMNSLYPSSILYGCVGTYNGDGTMTVSAGALTLHGEICKVEEHTISYKPHTRYHFDIIEEADRDGNKMFGDGEARDTYFLRRAKLVEQKQSKENNPTYNSTNLLTRLSNKDTPFVKNEIVVTNNQRKYITETKKTAFNRPFGIERSDVPKIGEHGINYYDLDNGIVMFTKQDDGLNSIPIRTAFNKNFASKTEILAGTSETTVVSPNKLQKHGIWNNPTLLTGWDFNSSVAHLKYRKTTDNYLDIINSVISTDDNSHVFTLVAPFTPPTQIVFYVNDFIGGIYRGVLFPNGQLHIYNTPHDRSMPISLLLHIPLN